MSNFYGTEIEICTGLGPVGSTEKTIWVDNEQLLRAFFYVFMDKNNNIVASALKSCIISLESLK